MNLENISQNKKRSKRKAFNEFKVVTDLVRKYKFTEKEEDLLDVIKALEGIVNTYTLVLTPGDANQQIYITPYMKKFLGMFLNAEERSNTTISSYNQAMAGVRWTMRHSTYEDMYAKILEVLVQAIKSMKIIGTCDCIYYIQLIVRYKLHDMVVKVGKDAATHAADITNDDEQEETAEEALDRISFEPDNAFAENNTINDCFYNDIDASVLVKTGDVFSCLGNYERYLLYLSAGLSLKPRQIYSILKFEDSDDLNERLQDIDYKLRLVANEEI